MLISEIPFAHLCTRLRRDGVHLDTGAFTVHLRIECPSVSRVFARMYGRYPIQDLPGIDDARMRVGFKSQLGRWLGGPVLATADGVALIEPVPHERGFTALESCLNWGVAAGGFAPIIMHSAVVEKGGRAILMPAPSGSGKSTLCAALAFRGWRLLSDEMAVFSFLDGQVLPNPRPISLKNRSICVVRDLVPEAVFSEVYRGTVKGDVAYVRAPDDAVSRLHEPAPVGLVLIPAYREGKRASARELSRVDAFRWLVESTVNYPMRLEEGFDLLTTIVERSPAFALEYSELNEAIGVISKLWDQVVDPLSR